MKKIKIVLMTLIMIILIGGLVGCGNSNNNNNNNQNNNTDTTKNETSQSSNSNEKVDFNKVEYSENAKKQVAMPEKGETIAIFHIKNYGDIKVKFFKDIAPKAVENFTTHAKDGYYNGQIFHRVIEDFMIQGGDPTGTGRGGESIWGKDFEDEFSPTLVPYRGALCMANAGADTNGSQFFIEQAKPSDEVASILETNGYPKGLIEAYKTYGGSMHLFYAHTVFGQVIEGMDVVDKIAATETDGDDKPTTDVVIESIEIAEF